MKRPHMHKGVLYNGTTDNVTGGVGGIEAPQIGIPWLLKVGSWKYVFNMRFHLEINI
ncbi:MAG: hypothetical protein Q8K59_06785 [Nitrosomonas sp.]|nr:hypothetical protein [Nitrosomonas sp.]